MVVKETRGFAITAVSILDINCIEMTQMHELKNRIKDVLISHKPEAKEKKYINDDDLKLMHAILSVFTKNYEQALTSAFDDFLKEAKRIEKENSVPTDSTSVEETVSYFDRNVQKKKAKLLGKSNSL